MRSKMSEVVHLKMNKILTILQHTIINKSKHIQERSYTTNICLKI